MCCIFIGPRTSKLNREMSLLLIMHPLECNLHRQSDCHYWRVSDPTDASVVSGFTGALPVSFFVICLKM